MEVQNPVDRFVGVCLGGEKPSSRPQQYIMSCETSTQKPTALLGTCAFVVEEKTFGGSHSCSD